MGIFSKKTNEPIDSDDLAKKVEEYNRKFLASQEPQKAEPAQVSQQARNQQASTPLVLEGIDEEAINVARTEIVRYVFVDMEEGPFTPVMKSAFSGETPSKELLTAVAQCYKIALHTIFTPEYSLQDAKEDSDLLKNYVARNYQAHLYLIPALTHAPIYATMTIAKLIQHQQGISEDEATESAHEALGTSMIELHQFGLTLIQNFGK